MFRKNIPGSKMPYGNSREPFYRYEEIIKASNGLDINQLEILIGIDKDIIQNWIKAGYLPEPLDKRFHENDVARILLMNNLIGSLNLDQIKEMFDKLYFIEEKELYNLLTKIIVEIDDEVIDTVENELKKLNYEDERLKESLIIMVYSYINKTNLEEMNKHLDFIKEGI